MKNHLCKLVLAAIIAWPATSFASELSLGSASNLKFTLNVDNLFYATPSNTYNVTNLMPGNHHLRMMSAPSNVYGAYSMPQLLFDGWVNVPQNARMTAVAMNYSQLNIVSVVPLMQQNYNPY